MKRAIVISAALALFGGIAILGLIVGDGTVRGQEEPTPTPTLGPFTPSFSYTFDEVALADPYYGQATPPAGTFTHATLALTSCTPAPSGLVSWWPGDGNAQDITDGNDGMLQGGTSFGAGVVGQAFSFDGFDDFVTVGNPANLQLAMSDFTVDAWVNFDSLVSPEGSPSWPCWGPGCDMSIVNKMVTQDGGSANADGWRLLKMSDNRFWFCLGSVSNGCMAGLPTTVQSTTIAAPEVWYHVAGVRSSQTISVYVNGVLEASKPVPSYVDTDSADVLIGLYPVAFSPPGALMYGRIDEVEIFNRAVSASEIEAIYNAGSAGKCKTTPPVGGMAELPDRAGAALKTAGTSSSRAGFLATIALAATAGAITLGGGARYAKRRRLP